MKRFAMLVVLMAGCGAPAIGDDAVEMTPLCAHPEEIAAGYLLSAPGAAEMPVQSRGLAPFPDPTYHWAVNTAGVACSLCAATTDATFYRPGRIIAPGYCYVMPNVADIPTVVWCVRSYLDCQ